MGPTVHEYEDGGRNGGDLVRSPGADFVFGGGPVARGGRVDSQLPRAKNLGHSIEQREKRQNHTDATDDQEAEKEIDDAYDQRTLDRIGNYRGQGCLASVFAGTRTEEEKAIRPGATILRAWKVRNRPLESVLFARIVGYRAPDQRCVR